MATITLDVPTGGYWLDNGTIKFLVKPSTMVEQLTILSLPRDVGYCYTNLNYWTEAGVNGTFYLTSIGAFTITPSASPLTTVTATLTKTYVDANSVTHTLTYVVSLTDGKGFADIRFDDVASVGLKRIVLSPESNLYPQGYYVQTTGGNFSAGGNTTYTVPAPYDNAVYSFMAKGLIQKNGIDQATVTTIDGYVACYSADASVGIFSRYVSNEKIRVYTLNTGTERQYAWLDTIPDAITKFAHGVNFYFGAWAVGSAAACVADYNALPLVEALTAAPAAQYNKVVRTDLNADLYDYNPKFHAILGDITTYAGNATMVPAGTVSFKFFKHRSNATTWNGVVKDLEEDFVHKSVTMCRQVGHRLFVEIDVLDATWNTANPTNRAIGVDEVTPFISGDGNYYWVKMTELITPGKPYHDAFVAYVTYLCQNYNFYGLVISECFYSFVDYSADSKALFLADNPTLTDWPRKVDGTINTLSETLGKWKTQKLGGLWSELKTIANTCNKKFFVMVEPNFAHEGRQAWEFGHYYPEAITHCDGLWVWGYYGNFGVSAGRLRNIYNSLYRLNKTYPTKENIISIGLWGVSSGEVITAADLKLGLDILTDIGWPTYGDGIEITPSKHMTAAHWAALWGAPLLLSSGYTSELRKGVNQINVVLEVELESATMWGYHRDRYTESVLPIVKSISSLQNKLDTKSGYSTRGQLTIVITGRDNFKNLIKNNYLKNKRVTRKEGFAGLPLSDYVDTFTGTVQDWSRRGDELTLVVSDDMVDASVKIPVENTTKTQNLDYRNTNPVDIMTDILATQLNIGASYIDLVKFAAERDTWLNSLKFDRVITEPKAANEYLNELQIETNSFIIHEGDKITYKAFAPITPGSAAEEWGDTNILANSLSVRSGYKDNFFNRVVVYYDYDESGSDKEENFEAAVIAADPASQSAGQWDEVSTKTIKSKWMRSRTFTQTANISGLKVYHVSSVNGIGAGTLTFTQSTNQLTYTAPGGSAGEAVTLSKDGKHQVFSSDKTKYIRVLVTTASLPAGNAADTITITDLGGTRYASMLASRLLIRFLNPVASVSFDVDINNVAYASKFIKPTDLKTITSDEACEFGDANWSNEQVMLTAVHPDYEKGVVKIEAIETKLYRRYGFIAPAGYPDYGSASAAQKERAFIGNANNKVNGGAEDGYHIW